MSLIESYKEAIKALHVAQSQFEAAESDFVTTAIYQLNAAESRVNALKIELERGCA